MQFGRHRRKLAVLVAFVSLPFVGHGAVILGTRMTPPEVRDVEPLEPSGAAPQTDPRTGITRWGASYTRVREGVREVYLEGDEVRVGTAHARLLRERMVTDEGAVWEDFTRFVPFFAARVLVTDIGRLRYRELDRALPLARRRELAAQSQAFAPDPFATHMATYQRFVFLHGLYDIALAFEHSPLLGCSAFVLGPELTADGHMFVARAFDFEVNEIFDRDKAVFLVREPGTIPFASVAWPGLVGVLTGMNAEGVFVSVNGARAGEPRSDGTPVVFALRHVLENAHDANEAITLLKSQHVMVSHVVLVADASGHAAVVERAPGADAFVREATTLAITNHFDGPLRTDPKNGVVRERSTTVPRRERLEEILADARSHPHTATVSAAIGMLRDHTCAAGSPCELGDRRAIDALIATHGVVADTTARVLWVSAGPHLSGRFVKMDLRALLAPGHDPTSDPPVETTDDDPILRDGRYATGRAHAGGPRFGGDRR